MEVLVGIAIVAIISVPLLNMFATSFKVGRHSYDIDQANAVALDTIEKFRAGQSVLALETGEYEATEYYDYGWNLAAEENYVFRVETKVVGKPTGGAPGADGDMQSAYLPQIFDSLGKSHTITMKLPHLSGETYKPTLTLADEGTYFSLASNAAILQYDGGAGVKTLTIPKWQPNITTFPVIVDNSDYATGLVEIQVTGISGTELALFVFSGEGGVGNDSVSITVTGGAASITKLKRSVDTLEFDLLEISARVIRAADVAADEVVLAEHVTTSYVVR